MSPAALMVIGAACYLSGYLVGLWLGFRGSVAIVCGVAASLVAAVVVAVR